jgi:8-oxo-dGTP diphosphatase
LTIKRGVEPGRGLFALPGGHLKADESLEDCARREFYEETGIDLGLINLKVMVALDSPERIHGDRCINFIYIGQAPRRPDVVVGSDAEDFAWQSVDDIFSGKFEFAFDNEAIRDNLRLLYD